MDSKYSPDFPTAPLDFETTHSRKSVFYRTLRVVTFLICAAGFAYQTWEFVNHFYTYPSVVDIQVERPEAFIAPAFTFCNNNRMPNDKPAMYEIHLRFISKCNSKCPSSLPCCNNVKRSKYCEKYPDYCEKPSDMEAFCSKKPHYCKRDISNFTIPKYPHYQSVSLEDVEDLGHDVGLFFTNFFDPAEIEGPFYFDEQAKALEYFPCYTYNTRFLSNLEPRLKEWEEENSHLVSFQLDVEEDEILNPNVEPGALLAIHHPFEPVNPYYGIAVKPGKTYHIYLHLEEKRFLPYPYKTDCIDYDELWLKHFKTGPRSRQMCIERCQTVFNMVCYQCIWTTLVHTKSNSLCRIVPDWECSGKDKLLRDLADCMSECKHECVKMKYHYRVEERSPENDQGDKIEERNLITIKIFLTDPEVKVVTHSPKYTMVELFSHVGGFLGLWIGISIWALEGYIGHLCGVVRTKCHRKRKSSKKSSNI